MKGSKYHNKKIEIDGLKFDSKGEYKYWLKLSEMAQNGLIRGLDRQVKVELIPRQTDNNGKFKYHPINWIADFVYEDDNGKHYLDYKGFQTEEFKIKKKLFFYKYKQEIEIVK